MCQQKMQGMLSWDCKINYQKQDEIAPGNYLGANHYELEGRCSKQPSAMHKLGERNEQPATGASGQ